MLALMGRGIAAPHLLNKNRVYAVGLIFALVVALAPMQAAPPEWVMVGLTDHGAEGISVLFVDRPNISRTPDEVSATISVINGDSEIRPRLQFECDGSRFRFLNVSKADSSEPPVSDWKELGTKPSGMLEALRYACSNGKADLGASAYKGPSPMPFYKRFIELRSQRNKIP